MLNTILILTALRVMQPHYHEMTSLTEAPEVETSCDNYDTYESPAISQEQGEDVTL